MTESELAEISEKWLRPFETYRPDRDAFETYLGLRRRYEEAIAMIPKCTEGTR